MPARLRDLLLQGWSGPEEPHLALNFNREPPQMRLVDMNPHLKDAHERVPNSNPSPFPGSSGAALPLSKHPTGTSFTKEGKKLPSSS